MAIIKRADTYTERAIQPVYYSDIGIQIDLLLDSDIKLNTNETAIIESVYNIIRTNKGERLFDSNFGCDLKHMLFENYTPQTRAFAEEAIRNAIENYEPRVEILELYIDDDPDHNGMVISLQLSIINVQEPIQTSFLISRVR